MPQIINRLREAPEESPPHDRLDSWKEIAAYLKFSERTVRRWEEEGLPVHRHPHKKKAAIYAYKAEIDAWWRDGHERLKQIEEAEGETKQPQPAALRAPWRRRPGLLAALGVASLALVVAALMASRFSERINAKSATASIHSVAVLPLENLSHDPEQEYFVDGMTDALITDLAKIHALRVISRNSVMHYKGSPKPMPQIARDLNVDAVVEGTVTRVGDRVRITAQLIDAPKDHHLWADTYEGDLRDVLSLQDQVAKAIASEVKIKLTPQEQTRLSSAHAVDPAAHEAYLRGMYHLQAATADENEKAISYFQLALTHDPNYAPAFAALAQAYAAHASARHDAPMEVMPKARDAALKAIALDESLADAHSSLAFVKLVFDWDWPGAELELRKALELDPSSPWAHVVYARYLLLVPHNVDEGVQEFRHAYALDPVLPAAQGDLVWFLFESRHYAESIEEAARELENDSPFLALSYAELGRRDEALAVADRAKASASVPVVLAQTASAYALAGRRDKAYPLLDGIAQQARDRYICGFNVACVYSALGDKEQAFAWLEKAYRERSD